MTVQAKPGTAKPPEAKVKAKKPSGTEQLKVERLVKLFKALGDPIRLQIVALLARTELCVCHIEGALDSPQSTVSRHLAVLRAAGVVTTRRVGPWVFYGLADQQPPELAAQLEGLTEQFAVPTRKGREC